MKKRVSGIVRFCLVLVLLLGSLTACGSKETDVLQETADFLLETVREPQCSSVGGEWTVLGLARSGVKVPNSYFEGYYDRLVQLLQEKDGVLSDRKYTEYSRVILALTAMGKDPTDVDGCNLLLPLGDQEKASMQGINGAVFALIALDSGGYEVPVNPEAAVQASRQGYVDLILERECEGGGWALSGSEAEADLTSMALQALAKYVDQPAVSAAAERGVEKLARLQQPDGGFLSWDELSCESAAQAITALCELGIPLDDPRFVRDGKTLKDQLLQFRTEEGGFSHVPDGPLELMATEQAFYALVSLQRVENGQSSLYRMTDEQ